MGISEFKNFFSSNFLFYSIRKITVDFLLVSLRKLSKLKKTRNLLENCKKILNFNLLLARSVWSSIEKLLGLSLKDREHFEISELSFNIHKEKF